MTTDENELIPPPEAIPEPEAAPEKPPVWSGWATFGLGAAIFAVYTVIETIVVMGIILLTYLHDGAMGMSEIEAMLQDMAMLTLDNMGLIISVSTIVGAVVMVGMVLLLVKAKKGAYIREYLALRPISGRTVLLLIAVTAGMLLAMDMAGMNLDDRVGQDMVSASYFTSVWPALFWIALVIGAPLAEEVFFRGFIYEGFARSRLGVFWAIVITALVWAVMHVQYHWQLIVGIFFMGLLFGYVRYKTGSLWSTLLMHVLNNLVAVAMLAMGVDHLLG